MSSAAPKGAGAKGLPKRISPCPITEAILEVRFESTLPADAIPGMAYDRLKADFPKMEKLPILQLPPQLLSKDPDLRFKPHYKLSGETPSITVNIGPEVISFITAESYPGWGVFSQQYKKILAKVNEAGFISKITRVGLRYINFFEADVFNLVTLSTTIGNTKISSTDLTIRAVIPDGEFKNTLSISNNVKVKIGKKPVISGSLIDIDTHYDTHTNVRSVIDTLLDTGHECEKKLFYNLLQPAYLESLNPEY